jgi:hypothetical protein
MLDKIFSALTVVRHAVAITVVTSAAGAMVAGSVDMTGTRTTATVAPSTTAVASAPSTTSTSERITMSLGEQVRGATTAAAKTDMPRTETAKTEPKKEPKTEPSAKPDTAGLSLLAKDCIAKYESAKKDADLGTLASEACRKAIEASGLSSNDFWARFAPKTTATRKPETTRQPEPTRKPEPARTPTTTRKPEPSRTPSVSTAQLEVLVRDCFDKYLVAKNTGEGGAAAAEACNKAIAASGLTRDAFFARFGTPGTK